MTVEESLVAALVAANTAAGARIDPLRLPQENIVARNFLDSLTYQRISTTKQGVLEDRYAGVCRPRFQVSCWSNRYLGAYTLREQVRVALEGLTGVMGGGVTVLGIDIAGGTDLFDPVTQLYHCTIDLFIPHQV